MNALIRPDILPRKSSLSRRSKLRASDGVRLGLLIVMERGRAAMRCLGCDDAHAGDGEGSEVGVQ